MQALREVLKEYLPDNRVNEILARANAGRPFNSVYDFAMKGSMTPEELSKVIDRLTAHEGKSIVGRVNVLTAPREVLRCLRGISGDAADDIIGMRPTARGSDASFVLNALTPEQIADAGAFITGRSYQYSADILAVSGDGRAFKRVRIVVDARQSPPVIIRRKDLTSLGWPLPEAVRQQVKHARLSYGGFRDVNPQGGR